MSLPVKFRKGAEHDVIAAQLWYEREERGLGSRFREYVDEAVGRVRIAPDRYPYANLPMAGLSTITRAATHGSSSSA